MESIQSWAVGICFCAAAISLITFLIPSGKMEKPVRLIAGAVFLLLLIAPFRSCQWNGLSFREADADASAALARGLEEQAERQVREQLEAGLRGIAEQALQEAGIDPLKIEIFMDTSNEPCISIEQIEITVSRADMVLSPAACETLKSRMGVPCTFVCGDE